MKLIDVGLAECRALLCKLSMARLRRIDGWQKSVEMHHRSRRASDLGACGAAACERASDQ